MRIHRGAAMFQESLVESTPLLRPRNRWPALASIALQTILVAIFLTIPLLYPEALTLNPTRLTTLAPPRLRATPPPPTHVVTAISSAPSLAPPTEARRLPAPSIVTDAPPVDSPGLAVGISGTPNPSPFATLTSGNSSSPHVAVAGPTAGSARPVRMNISSGVIAGLLLEPIRPVYPPIARMTRMEGTVVVQAIISKTGHIESAHAISGSAIFYAAALDAVKQARYHPYLLNNEPTEVETTITINFRLGS
jgi:protein TonB